MIAPEDVTLVLLAAGRSVRFGEGGSKLDEDLGGIALGLHVAAALARVPFARRLAVTSCCRIDYASHGFEVIRNSAPQDGLASSVRLGVAHAKVGRAAAVLIALADMPRISEAHVHRLLHAAGPGDAVVASSDGAVAKPPVIFGHERFDALMSLSGDEGARAMIRAGRHVVASPAELIDVDTPDDLAALRALVGSPEIMRAG